MTSQRRLRIAYVVPDLGVGGAERHVTTLMPCLDRSRFDPSVLCIGGQGELFSQLERDGVPAVALARGKRQALLSVVDLVREFRRLSPDVVILRGFNAEVLGRVAAVLAKVRCVVVWVHNCDDTEPRGFLRRLSDRVLDRETDAYFGVAKAQIPYMVDELGYPREKVRIIYNGVDPAQFDGDGDRQLRDSLGFSDADLVVGILAALRPEKDHETFLRAASLIASQVENSRFLIVGGGDRKLALEQLAAEAGIADRVVFTGPRNDVPDLLRAMDLFVLCSYTVECFPMALLEAMATSRAAVCSAVGGIPEMIEEGITGRLVAAKDPNALADGVVKLLRDPDLRRTYGKAARARVESHFTLRQSVHEAERQLLDVASRRSERTRPIHLTLVLDEAFVGGAELLMLDVFRAFDPDVVQPKLVCLRSAGSLIGEFRAAGFEVDVLDRSGRFDLRTLPRLVRSLRDSCADAVLVTHHHRAALALGRAAAHLARVPVNMVAAHDMDLTSIGQRCLPRWAVASLFSSDALVLLSPSQGDYLHQEEGVGRRPWSRTREVVIPNGIDLPPYPDAAVRCAAREQLGLAADDFVVGIVARLSVQKAHHVLFEAFALFAQSWRRARLVVIGGGEREAELHDLAQRLGIAKQTVFTGIRRDVPNLLPAFDVSCLTSVHEGIPITVIESMAAGLPMVATDCGGLRDMITDGEHGFIVPIGDVSTFVSRLQELATDPAERVRQGRAARAKAEQLYSVETTARGYEALLTDLVLVR